MALLPQQQRNKELAPGDGKERREVKTSALLGLGRKRHSTEMNGAEGARYKNLDSFRVGWGSCTSPVRKLRA